MQFEVPQFIEVEDKIFGQLSLKQFIYVAGAGGAAAILYFYLPFFLFLVLAPFVVALGLGLAFVPVNKRPLSVLIESVVVYFSRARLYLWKKEHEKPVGTPDITPEKTPTYTPPPAHNTISNLARTLELEALSQNSTDRDKPINKKTNHA